jgi:citrate synthase
MMVLSAMVASLSAFYTGADGDEDVDLNIIRLLAKAKTIAALSYKKSVGQPFIYPRNDLSYTQDFLHMMFAVPTEPYEISPVLDSALNLLLILHADHEQNCSTSTVRMVGSSKANLFSAISAGISALWGPLHGGANQKVIEMLRMIRDDDGDFEKYVNMAKDKDDPFRLMGFGHRVYKNFDPRATRKLYPNVDFYSGIIYRAMGIPVDMFTVMFALGRLPGWISQWKEMTEDPNMRISRPRQIYTGAKERPFVPIAQR